jgi:hypothetical protein
MNLLLTLDITPTTRRTHNIIIFLTNKKPRSSSHFRILNEKGKNSNYTNKGNRSVLYTKFEAKDISVNKALWLAVSVSLNGEEYFGALSYESVQVRCF